MYHVLHLQPVCAHQYPSILGFSRDVFVVVCSEINLTELLLRGGAGLAAGAGPKCHKSISFKLQTFVTSSSPVGETRSHNIEYCRYSRIGHQILL